MMRRWLGSAVAVATSVEATCEATYRRIKTTSAAPVALFVMSGRNRNFAECGATLLQLVFSTYLPGRCETAVMAVWWRLL